MEPPSGKQLEIRHARQRAVIVEVGGGLREYEANGRPVCDGYSVERQADGGRGQPLLPWPNRLEDGRYEFDGQTLQLPIDEHARNNASHGLTRWLNWQPIEHTRDQVRLALIIHPRPGYPFTLGLQIAYTLDERGLTVATTATNLGDRTLPFGAGQHPYFTVGTARVNEAALQVPALGRLELDAERRLPTSKILTVKDTPFDFRKPHPIDDLVLDDCFCGLIRDANGLARATLSSTQTNSSVSVWVDQHYRYIQVFTGDTLAPERQRQGLAIEPMTCPPNAFRSGTELIRLEPGQTIELQWGVEPDFAKV
jgi:aldose 1-epimerase